MNEGKRLREEKLKKRNSLTALQRENNSRAVQNSLFELEEMIEAETIFIYVSFRSEVETLAIIRRLLAENKKVCVPITLVKERKMEAVEITSIENDLEPGYCGIPEPKRHLLEAKITDGKTIDAVIVPGSVFDERGGRFGYGGGYYDRFLQQIPRAARIGIGFECQIVEKAPLQEHDELLDFVITEKRVIRSTGR